MNRFWKSFLWWIHPGINEEPRHRLGYLSPVSVGMRNFTHGFIQMGNQMVMSFNPAIRKVTSEMVKFQKAFYEAALKERTPNK